MRSWFRKWAVRAFEQAMHDNLANVAALLASASKDAALVDLGCDDGELTQRLAAALDTDDAHGVEIVAERGELARRRGIAVCQADLNERLPYADASFDVALSNQVIEHLADTDNFVRELHRILKPGGFAVVSTENLSSWHNIVALLFGWQPFSLSNVSDTALGLGNPLSVHRGEENPLVSWQHVRVFAFRGLRELFKAHGFEVEALVGAGYYPFPRRLARWDPRHAAFLTIKVRHPVWMGVENVTATGVTQ